jgi:hypothetical protein
MLWTHGKNLFEEGVQVGVASVMKYTEEPGGAVEFGKSIPPALPFDF